MEHARVLVDWCIDAGEGDLVVVSASPEAEELVVALHRELGERGAEPVTLYSSDEASRAFLKAHDGDFVLPEHALALYEASDSVVSVRSDPNLSVMSDVDGETLAERSRATKPLQEERLSKNWVLTQHPTNAHAQNAGMSLEEYRDFVYDATLRDWSEVEETQEVLRERLDGASEVRVVADETDVRMSVEGNVAVNSAGRHNMPSGEVFTAPVPDSVEGHVTFDKPLIHRGREMEGVYLEFEDGVVVEFSAEREEDALADLLDTDEGARRLGELGIGTNREIDRFTKNILFDEKMGETVHMALGRAYEENVGEGVERNDSAVHVDMIVDVSGGRLEFDGEVVQEDGRFVWE
ncbi:MAG: aminopeptidase [Halobacteriota archaeon]